MRCHGVALLISLLINLLSWIQCLEFFSGTAVVAGVFSAAAFIGRITVCKIHECCAEDHWTRFNYTNLKAGLIQNLFGQHIAVTILPQVIKNHVEDKNPKKALVLSFHGWTGGGKNYASDLIVEHLYARGVNSQYVHKLIASNEFAHEHDYKNVRKVHEYRRMVKNLVVSKVKACERSIFIFDEVDKMPQGVMDILQPFLDYHHQVEGVDYRKSIFIFLSNLPGNTINAETLNQFQRGLEREQISAKHMEDVLKKSILHVKNGLKNAAIIEANLVDFFIPFLPLERKHVIECALAETARRGKRKSQTMAELAADQLSYEGPAQFSTTGCKLIAKKMDMFL